MNRLWSIAFILIAFWLLFLAFTDNPLPDFTLKILLASLFAWRANQETP